MHKNAEIPKLKKVEKNGMILRKREKVTNNPIVRFVNVNLMAIEKCVCCNAVIFSIKIAWKVKKDNL